MPLELALPSIQEEATESLSDTRREATDGDPEAGQKLQLRSDEQASGMGFNPYQPPPPPGSFLNVKA